MNRHRQPYDRPLEGFSSANWDREHFVYGDRYESGYEMADRFHDRTQRAEQFRHTRLQPAAPGGA
jgi:hypothetical protein